MENKEPPGQVAGKENPNPGNGEASECSREKTDSRKSITTGNQPSKVENGIKQPYVYEVEAH